MHVEGTGKYPMLFALNESAEIKARTHTGLSIQPIEISIRKWDLALFQFELQSQSLEGKKRTLDLSLIHIADIYITFFVVNILEFLELVFFFFLLKQDDWFREFQYIYNMHSSSADLTFEAIINATRWIIPSECDSYELFCHRVTWYSIPLHRQTFRSSKASNNYHFRLFEIIPSSDSSLDEDASNCENAAVIIIAALKIEKLTIA